MYKFDVLMNVDTKSLQMFQRRKADVKVEGRE